MEKQFRYSASAQFHQNDRCFASIEQGVPRVIDFAAPPEFGGETGVWTPEHFLLAAVSSCFIETFKAIAGASKLEFQGIEVGVDGLIEKEEGGFRFTKISIHPKLILYHEESHELAERVLSKTERCCLVVRSLSSQVRFEDKVLVEAAVTA
jgi:organic hydroperoxide reductase OsmC/OhrA